MKKLTTAATLAALALTSGKPALAHGGEDYLGSVFAFAIAGSDGVPGYCPRGSRPADGSILQISEYSALFAVIGANYGGDGRTTFGLPDFRDAALTSANGQRMGYCIVVEGTFPSRS
ncbi:MAG: phage tail protein [Pseudomonadota bacterium]